MNSLVRRSLFGLLALAALETAVLPNPAHAALRDTCIGRRFPVIGQADVLIRAGRITVVQTTLAFARVLKHEALAQNRAAAAARTGGR